MHIIFEQTKKKENNKVKHCTADSVKVISHRSKVKVQSAKVVLTEDLISSPA